MSSSWARWAGSAAVSLALAGALAVSSLAGRVSAQGPPTPAEIEASIQSGLTWLVAQQAPDGGWGFSWDCDRVALTGLVVLKLEAMAIEKDMDPQDPAYEYSAEVKAGLDFITSPANMHTEAVGPGDLDANGNGIRVYFTDCGWHRIYQTGIAIMALSVSRHPELYKVDVEDAVDFAVSAQVGSACGLNRGGWGYELGKVDCWTDNSNSGYLTLGLGLATSKPPWGFEIPIPQMVKDELSIWIDAVQDQVTGDPDDGGSQYTPGGGWVNILKTGNLLFEMALVGDDLDTPRVKNAIDYLERTWAAPGGCDAGWRDHRQAMFAMMKGLEVFGIERLDLDGDGTPEADWFGEVSEHLLSTQLADGSWPGDCWSGSLLSTTWALLTLERVVQPRDIPVPLDIKPTSCPNPVNTKSQGVLPVAILGTADFDVTQIDPASLYLVNPLLPPTIVALPLRWSYEDVGTPYEPFVGKTAIIDCTTLGADGFLDLAVTFDTQAVVPVLGTVADGQAVLLQLRGSLKEEFGGTPIVGEDVVWVLVKGK